MIRSLRSGGRALAVGPTTLAVVALSGIQPARAQDTTASDRVYLLEWRLGGTAPLGGRTAHLVNTAATAGATFAFQISHRSWGWVSADYTPWQWSDAYRTPDMPPGGSMYALITGVSRTFGLPFASARWKPFEAGLGLGATQTHIEMPPNIQGAGTAPPPDAPRDDVSGLLSYRRWRPAAAARLRVALPIGPLRLSATAGLLATYVGDVPLWDGRWEPVGDGSRYRPSSRIWSYGTTLTAPVTLGLGLRF